jgi:hypothetical protein
VSGQERTVDFWCISTRTVDNRTLGKAWTIGRARGREQVKKGGPERQAIRSTQVPHCWSAHPPHFQTAAHTFLRSLIRVSDRPWEPQRVSEVMVRGPSRGGEDDEA